MQPRSERPKPPARVMLVVVLAYVVGMLDILAGLLLILLRYDEEVRRAGDAFAITLWGALMILAGLFVIAVASGLTRARRDARVLATIATALSAVVAAVDVVLDPSDPWFQVAAILLGALVIVALWAGRSGEFFRGAPARR